jgi:hypothetical protein
MKPIYQTLTAVALCALAIHSTAQALDLSSFTSKATEAVSGSSASSIGDIAGIGNSDLLSMGTDLLKSFQGNEAATSAASGLMKSFNADNYLGAFDYYNQIKEAGLTTSQLQTWNDIKNPLSSIILERNFDFEESGLSDLVSKASGALQDNDTAEASSYLDQLKDAASLTSGQKTLLQKIQSNLLPVEG